MEQIKSCSRCHQFKPRTEFHNYKGISGAFPRCKECCKEIHKKRYVKRERKPFYIASSKCYNQKIRDYNRQYGLKIENRFSKLKSTAKYRNINFDLTLDEFKQIQTKNCYYCDGELPKIGGGVDRIDSTLGYTFLNIRACCKICNIAKNNLTDIEFFNHIAIIYKNIKEKQNANI